MKSIYSIFAAAVLSSLCVQADDNFSLWPRRPQELQQARRLIAEKKGGEAVHLIQPYLKENGIAGREARQIASAVNVPRYLSRLHPTARVYVVKNGDSLTRISADNQCPADVLMMLNGIVAPSDLKVGQKLVLVTMDLSMEIRPQQREICVWHGDKLVADYNIVAVDGRDKKAYGETEIAAREGYMGGQKLSVRSYQYPSSNRVLVLGNGVCIAGEQGGGKGFVVRLKQADVNELTLLMNVGNRVTLVDEAPVAGK